RVGESAVRRITIDEAAPLTRATGPTVPAAALVAAAAADGLVVDEQTIADVPIGEGSPQAAPRARAAGSAVRAAAAVPAGAADRPVAGEPTVLDGHGRGGNGNEQAEGIIAQGAADAVAGVTAVLAGSAVGPVAPVRQVAVEGAVRHRRLAAAST